MKQLFYVLSILVFIIAVLIIGFHLNFIILAVGFFTIGAAAAFFGGERFALYLFAFIFPFINASPALLGSQWPYNYTAPALFLLCGMCCLRRPETLSRKGFWTSQSFSNLPGAINRDFYAYYLFSLLLFVSAVFVFLRWSNITLGHNGSIGIDTPVSAPLPRFSNNQTIIWFEQRLSTAVIFPIITLFLYFIAPYIFFYIKKINPEEKTIFKWLSFGFYISTSLAILQKFAGQSHLSDRLGKEFKQFHGGFSDFNAFGVFAGMMFLWSTYEIKKKNVVGYTTFAISLVGGILSGSRTMFFFAAAGIANLLLDLAKKSRERKQKWIVISLIAIFLVLIIFAGGTLKKRLIGADWDDKETLFDKLDAAVNGRLKMTVFSLEIIRDYFFTGIGAGNYTFYLTYKNYLPYKDSGKIYLYDLPMNQYLWIFVENGFLAFLFFTYFLVCLYRRSNKKLMIGTILVVLLFNNFFWFPEAFLLFWILAAISYTYPSKVKQTETPNKKALPATIISLVILILFNIISFNKLHPYTWARETGISYDYGLWPGEKDAQGKYFNWTKNHAGIYLTLDKNGESPLIKIICGAPFNHLKPKEQKVNIYWNGKQKQEIVFTGNEAVEFKIKSTPLEQGVLEIKVRPVFNLKKMGVGDDNRNLGVCKYTSY